jgi:hypothetical protein
MPIQYALSSSVQVGVCPDCWTQVDRLEIAAVTVLRGDGGTFPSQAQMSDAKAVQERVEGAHTARNPACTAIVLEPCACCVPGQSERSRRQITRFGFGRP